MKNLLSSSFQRLPRAARRWLLRTFRRDFHRSYSQHGEDMLLRSLFRHRRSGFYVDLGALDPRRYSNTQYFYERGWKGINVDAMPGSMALFRKLRPRDINVEAAVGPRRELMTYYMFAEPAFNGIYPTRPADEFWPTHVRGQEIVDSIVVKTVPLSELLAKHVPQGVQIDFLSIDIEGLELELLESNDWDRFRPRAIAVELTEGRLERIVRHPIHVLLDAQGYRLAARSLITAIYARDMNGK